MKLAKIHANKMIETCALKRSDTDFSSIIHALEIEETSKIDYSPKISVEKHVVQDGVLVLHALWTESAPYNMSRP